MPNHLQDTTTLHNGVQMPWFGLGTWKAAEGEEVEQAVQWALEIGYRSIDTASIYGNEAGVGRALRASGVPREQVFVTTKLWNTDHGYEQALRAFDASLERLSLDYVDLYLIHWPGKGRYKQSWRALEKIYSQRRARAIGVSNFLVHHLDDLLRHSEISPMVNQIEFHPQLQQPEVLAFCRAHQVQVEAWSPLMRGTVFENPTLTEIGQKYGKSAAQVVLRWNLQRGVVTIPKSVRREHLVSNTQIFDFELAAEDLATIDAMDRNERLGPHPDQFE